MQQGQNAIGVEIFFGEALVHMRNPLSVLGRSCDSGTGQEAAHRLPHGVGQNASGERHRFRGLLAAERLHRGSIVQGRLIEGHELMIGVAEHRPPDRQSPAPDRRRARVAQIDCLEQIANGVDVRVTAQRLGRCLLEIVDGEFWAIGELPVASELGVERFEPEP